MSSVSTEDLPEAELRRTLRKYFGPYLDDPDNRMRPERMAHAIRALDENGAEVDRWTVGDEEATRFVENR